MYSLSDCREFTKRTLRDIIHGEEVDARELGGEVESMGRRAFRGRMALGIVALSILAALAGWRASVFDEASSTASALYHEEILLQQQRQSIHEGQVATDLSEFNQFEQHWLMHRALEVQAGSPGAPAALRAQSQQEAVAADETLQRFGVNQISFLPNGTPTYDAAVAYRYAATGDTELQGLRPADAIAEAVRRGNQAVRLALAAALFVAGLLLLTLAQTMLGRRVIAARGSPRREGAWSISHTLAAGATLVSVVAAGMFIAALLQ
jgi:hypothetical protein